MPSKEKIKTERLLSDSKSFSGDDYDDIISDFSENEDDFLSPLELSISGTQENIECLNSAPDCRDDLVEDGDKDANECRIGEIFDFINRGNKVFSSERYEYVIVKLLGCGCYGDVFLARRNSIKGGTRDKNELVAIKIINFEKIKSNKIEGICGGMTIDVIDQISDEINILTTLNNHENVISYCESFCIKPHYLAFVTEYVSGYTLRDVYKSYGSFPEALVCYISESVLKVLVALDKSNYRYKRIHKDIKSTNIMINYDDCKIKLLDFGVSQIIDTVVDNNTPKISSGTLQWMSPELIQHKEYNNLTDIWSLGVTLLELSIGRVPRIHELFSSQRDKDKEDVSLGLKPAEFQSTNVESPANGFEPPSVIERYMHTLVSDGGDENTRRENQLVLGKIRSFSGLYLDFLDKMLTVDLNKRWDCNRLVNHPFILRHRSKCEYISFQKIEKELYYFNNKFDVLNIVRNNVALKIYRSINSYFFKSKLSRGLVFLSNEGIGHVQVEEEANGSSNAHNV
ncbi:Ser/Thr protein kinase [Cryptosporidium ryanae]|uniref:Ser/Thr protein kinase n=1 Tax=Cryptosporidium ryanae TaxID=515981 RepID=UPI00351A7BC6|nr:Ser/Thr protein kinase [Cryptosporidium ryanae]